MVDTTADVEGRARTAPPDDDVTDEPGRSPPMTANTCRCHLPLDPPEEPHWWPTRVHEPGPEVRAVTLAGRDPRILRYVRVPGGWHAEGAAACHPDHTPPRPWGRLGQCWDGVEHPVVGVWDAELTTSRHRCPGRCGREVSFPLFACPPCWGRLPEHLRRAITRGQAEDRVMYEQAMRTAGAWYRGEAGKGFSQASPR